MKKIFSCLLGTLLLACNSDDSIILSQNNGVTFLGYKSTSLSVYDDGITPDYKLVITGNILNNKLVSEKKESFVDDVSQGSPEFTKQYFYSDDLLVKIVSNDDVKDFFYDDQQNLIGLTRYYSGDYSYYRFVHISQSLIYFEKTSLPFDDPNTHIIKRMIAEFNNSNEIVKAGFDNNLDGIFENYYLYSYLNGNVLHSQSQDAVVENYTYSNVVNNFKLLEVNSFGKKNLNIICVERFAYNLDVEKLSYHLDSNTFGLSLYEVLNNDCFSKETTEKYYSGFALQNTLVTEFFFE